MKTLFFLKAKCGSTGRDFYIRYDFAADDMWVKTYGLKSIPTGEKVGSEGIKIDMSLVRWGPQYKCPHCGNTSMVRCGACGEYTCFPEEGEKFFKCAHCDNSGKVSGSIENIESNSSGSGQ